MAGAAGRAVRQALAAQQLVYKAHNPIPQSSIGRSGDRPIALQRLGQKRTSWVPHRGGIFQLTPFQFLPWEFHGEQLQNTRNDNARDGLRLREVHPPKEGQLSVEDARRLLRVVQLEALKTKLKEIPNDCISYGELLRLCMDSICNSSGEEARGIAKLLDESGQILVLGHTVYLRPHKVAKAIENAIPLSAASQCDLLRRDEMERMERQKGEIDGKAQRFVRSELWCGFGFMSLQTLAFMRLTFWELSWDVMEPICFYAASAYFLAGYAFYLRTSRDPTFESFFNSRFDAWQRHLMRKGNFDIERFRDLQRTCRPGWKPSSHDRGMVHANLDD